MRRAVFLAFLFPLALAQVGLLDGPRPSTEVRGTLQGDMRQGYKVVVEFLVEGGANPVQGSTTQSLSWNGTLTLWVSGWETFRLSGYTPNTPYNGAVFNVYDSQNRLRGRAAITTARDGQNRPSYHQVQYAVWPLQGQKVWMPSPDNPVPLEAGGWLSATPPGGGARERYRYPGMESYQPPSVQGSILSGLSPADRDVAAKVLLSSLADLRAFYARQPRGSTLWFFVPEVSAWTQTLAQEFGSQNGGQARFVVPEGTARTYCSLYRDPRFHVMPRDALPKEQAFAVIYPPAGATQKGAVMAGRYLVDRPDWQETDYLSFTTPLSPTQDGLPEAQAYVWGYISRADLKARVEFKEWTLSSYNNLFFALDQASPWDGTFTRDAGRGQESFYLEGFPADTATYTVKDGAGRNRGTASVTVRRELVGYDLDTSAGVSFDFGVWAVEVDGLRFGLWVGGQYETFTAYGCTWRRAVGATNIYACNYKDDQGRYRGSGEIGAWWRRRQVTGTVYPLKPRYEVKGYGVAVYLKGWVQTWRPATDNDRPVEAGGYVTAEGKRYRIPGLEGYLSPTGKDIEAAEGDPYVSYITQAISPGQAPLGGTGRGEAKAWFKPLRDWCAERGL
ncbi:hypothetical protein [Thermus sp.]|uniref:hypothetical protein n=1 Tax=Thermus sp. TaxID=275 RepID=UPI003D1531C8